MIEYIFISYVVMFLFGVFIMCKGDSFKSAFKAWLLAPVSMPLIAFALFIGW